MLECMPIAKIDNLQFAAGNEAYQTNEEVTVLSVFQGRSA